MKIEIRVALVGLALLTGLSVAGCRKGKVVETASESTGPLYPACIPTPEPEGNLHLAVGQISVEKESTRIRLVGYAVGGPAEFVIPQYIMSRGRWMIGEGARSYIRDENCREYKLQDRVPTQGKVPDNGVIKLRQGESWEVTLVFPRLEQNVRRGSLVYAKWVFPFTL
mgnify:CR=1 FL=1